MTFSHQQYKKIFNYLVVKQFHQERLYFLLAVLWRRLHVTMLNIIQQQHVPANHQQQVSTTNMSRTLRPSKLLLLNAFTADSKHH